MEEPGENTQDMAPPGPRPGELLRGARERLAMSVADVARLLRLSPRQVEAIEADEYHRLPGGPFVRGFVRNYARLLQIEPEPLLETLNGYAPVHERSQLAPESKEIPFPTVQKRSWSRVAALGALLLLALGLLVFEGYQEYLPQGWEMVTTPPTVTPAPVAVPVPQPGPEPVIAVQPIPIPPPAPVMEVASPPSTTEPEAPPAAAEPPPKPASGKIRLEFEGDSWVEVRDRAGKAIHSQLNRGGSTRTVEGNPPLSLVVGNASLVRVFYNGEPVDLEPHSRVGVARVTLK